MSNFKDMARKPGQANGAAVAPLVDAAELDAKIYGSLGELSAGKIVAKPIDIRQIEPDFAQPRQQIPSAVRARWNRQVDADSMADLFGAWTMAYAEEIGVPFEQASSFINAVLDGDMNESVLPMVMPKAGSERKVGVMQSSLMTVVWLAANIKGEGHHNPILIYRTGNDGYRIIDGERRWLAHCLLAVTEGPEQWGRIKAIVEDRPNVWAQADNNNQNEKLKATELARQFALLLMDLYTAEGYTFQPYEAFEHDMGFYAQVADGTEWAIPRNGAARLMQAMGNMSAGQMRQYRALLRLPSAVWTMAHDLGWGETFLREIKSATNSPEQLTRMAAAYAREQGYTVTGVTVSDADEGQEWSDGAMLDAAAEEQFRSIVGDEPPQWDGVAVDEDGVAFDAWTDTPLPTPSPSPADQGGEQISQVWENPWDNPAMDQKRLNLMSFAFSRARGNWFRPADVGFGFELLQALVERGELESQSPTFNKQDRSLWKFRITPKGCGVLGRTYGQWDDPQQPISRPPATYGTLPPPPDRPQRPAVDRSILGKTLDIQFDALKAIMLSDLNRNEAERADLIESANEFCDAVRRLLIERLRKGA
jgi:hypothetical protein